MASALEALKAVYKAKPENEDESGVCGDESVSEALSKEVFSNYVCRRAPTFTPPAFNFQVRSTVRLTVSLTHAGPLTGAFHTLEILLRQHHSGTASSSSTFMIQKFQVKCHYFVCCFPSCMTNC